MRRISNLYEQICSISNLELADQLAQKSKDKSYGVINHNKNRYGNLLKLQNMFLNKTYQTSAYQIFKVFEPKERDVYRLPYFPDRIAHYAIMNVLEPIFVSTFTSDTYSCIKGMGLHRASRGLKRSIKDVSGTAYCLKLDIKKFYPSVDHDILKSLLRRKFKDVDLLWLLDEIIDSAPGLPIGNYLSQYFANFYLTYFDHWLKEVVGVKHYFRYADDIVILHADKSYLHRLRVDIEKYLSANLKLAVKENYQVFPVVSRGIDLLGYVHYHTHTRLRKSIKKRFALKVAKGCSKESIASYLGWLKHADCINLKKNLLPNEVILDIQHNHTTKLIHRGQDQNIQNPQ